MFLFGDDYYGSQRDGMGSEWWHFLMLFSFAGLGVFYMMLVTKKDGEIPKFWIPLLAMFVISLIASLAS